MTRHLTAAPESTMQETVESMVGVAMDLLPEEQHHVLGPVLDRLAGTERPADDHVTAVRFAAWALASVTCLGASRHDHLTADVLALASRWPEGPGTRTIARAAAARLEAAVNAEGRGAPSVAGWVLAAAHSLSVGMSTGTVRSVINCASTAAGHAVSAVYVAHGDDALVPFLHKATDELDRLLRPGAEGEG